MKKVSQKLLLVVLSMLVGFLAVEGLVRIFLPQQLIVLRPDIWRPDSTGFGHRHWENAETTVNVGQGEVHFVTDSNGFRIDPTMHGSQGGASELAAYEHTVLMIGDSFLASLTVEAMATIPAVLERKFSPARVRFDNTGVGGWGPNHYLLQARQSLDQWHYDLGVVFLYVGNDVITERVDSFPARPHTARHKLRWPSSFSKGGLIDALFYPVNDFMETHSHGFVLFKKRLRVPLARLGLTAYYFPEIFETRLADDRRWTVTASVCADIGEVFERHNVPVVFVFIPTHYQVYEEEFENYVRSFRIDRETVDLDQPNRILRRELAANGLHVIDPLDAMRSEAHKGAQLYGNVDIHLNVAGNMFVAEYIYATVLAYTAE